MIYGCLRVSTDGQSFDAQAKQLRVAGAEKVFRETASGVKMGRPPKLTAHQTKEAMKALAEADLAWRFNVSQSTIPRLQT